MVPFDDPRLAAYRNLKDKEIARDGGRFIVEGEHVVRRLLASRIRAESVLVAERKAAAIVPAVPAGVQVWVATDETIERVIGFEFHSGVLACGVRPPSPTLEDVLGHASPEVESSRTLLVCPQITNLENLGSLVRLSAAFGVDAMLLGERCCDPFFRQCVRVSMGSVFTLPIVRSTSILNTLARLRQDWGFEIVATVLSEDAEALASSHRRARLAILFGSEADGLSPEQVGCCDRKVTIPMRRGTDSLNVAVAAGIFLYHFVDVCGSGEASRKCAQGPAVFPLSDRA